MVQKVKPALGPNERPPAGASAFDVTEDDLADGTALRSDEFTRIFEEQASKTRFLFPGQDNTNRQIGNIGDYFGDIQGTNDGGSTYEQVQGHLRIEVYEDERLENLKAVGPKISLRALRNAETESLMDRPIQTLANPGAAEDEYIAISVKTTSAYDGYALSAANSSFQYPLTEVDPRA